MSFARRHRNEFGLLLAILLVLGAAVVSNESWQNERTAEYNAKVLVRSASVLGIFALGAGVVILSGGIDLSAGSVIAFSATVCGGTLLFLADKTPSGQPDMVNLTGGIHLDVMSTYWSSYAQQLAAASLVSANTYELSQNAAGDSIRVWVDGTEWTTGWHYDPSTNEIIFDAAPPQGAAIEVEYGVLVPC